MHKIVHQGGLIRSNYDSCQPSRYDFATSPLDGTLWIHGGTIAGQAMTNTTFFIHLNGTVEVGPALPTVLAEHCATSLHDGNVMILGKTRNLRY